MTAVPARALVLAAGLGTRLQPLTRARAKAAAPVDGEPLARRTIRWLVGHGITDLVLNLHHQPESITAVVGDGRDLGARVRYSWESPVLGSGGGPRHALPLLLDPASPRSGSGETGGQASRTFVLVNGDTLTDVNLAAMAEQHRRTGALVTLALIPNPRPDKYGGVLLDDNHAVTGFTRRRAPGGPPAPGEVEGSFHFIGPQIVEAEVFMPLEDGVPAESVLQIYPALMKSRPGSVTGFVSNAAFHDIGTPADLLQTSLDLAAADGRIDQPRWGRGVHVDASARVTRSVLWDDVTVGRGAALSECVVADGVHIPDGAVMTRCAIVRGPSDLEVVKLDG
jgi:mannose-1-phosphate guanylyltransferase/phosphomannomutase